MLSMGGCVYEETYVVHPRYYPRPQPLYYNQYQPSFTLQRQYRTEGRIYGIEYHNQRQYRVRQCNPNYYNNNIYNY